MTDPFLPPADDPAAVLPSPGDLGGGAVGLYLTSATSVVALLRHPMVTACWARPDALPGMTVGELAAHLARSVRLVAPILAEPLPDGPGADRPTVDAAGYFAAFQGLDDRESSLSAQVRERSVTDAAAGPATVLTAAELALDDLLDTLPGLDPQRPVCARGVHLPLSEYLRTRLVEFCVHADDLTHALGLDPDDPGTPMPSPDAAWDAAQVLLAVARHRHGAGAELRALARRERDTVRALRVL